MYQTGDGKMTAITLTEARDGLGDLINRVAYAHERILILRRGKIVAAIVPIGELELLQKLEDHIDLRDAKEALAGSDERIPYDTIRKELGL
jgi:prevent-host-death family protein